MAKQLLAETDLTEAKVRLLGITVSNFGEKTTNARDLAIAQLPLF
jgi:hypothetical protein